MALARFVGRLALWAFVSGVVQASADDAFTVASSAEAAAEELPPVAVASPSRTPLVRRDGARGSSVMDVRDGHAHASVQAGGAIILQQAEADAPTGSEENPPMDPPDDEPVHQSSRMEPVKHGEHMNDTLMSRVETVQAQRAGTAPEAECVGGWQTGDGLGDSETEVGLVSDQNTCAQKVKADCPAGNGASYAAASRECLCIHGQWGVGTSTEKVNCQFPQLQMLPKTPTWGTETAGRYCSGSWTGDLQERKIKEFGTCKELCVEQKTCVGIVVGTYQGVDHTCVLCTSDTWTSGGQTWATGYEFDRGFTITVDDPDKAVHDIINNPPRDPFETTEWEYNITQQVLERNPPVTNSTFQQAISGEEDKDPSDHEETITEYETAEKYSQRRRASPTEAPLPSPPQYRRPTPAPTRPFTDYYEEPGVYAAGKFSVGTNLCPGRVECQFETLELCKHYCDIETRCTAVIHGGGSGKCAGGLGCYTPRFGTVAVSTTFAGRLWVKQFPSAPTGVSQHPSLGAKTGVSQHPSLEATKAEGKAEDAKAAAKAANALSEAMGAVTRPASGKQLEGESANAELKPVGPHNEVPPDAKLPTNQHIQMLLDDPNLTPKFDLLYGDGSAARILDGAKKPQKAALEEEEGVEGSRGLTENVTH